IKKRNCAHFTVALLLSPEASGTPVLNCHCCRSIIMSKALPIRIVLGTWDRLRDDAYSVRHEVFVVEQAVPVEIELDDDDPLSVHAVAYGPDNVPIATGRLLPDGHIGRMAVRKLARGTGVGGQV